MILFIQKKIIFCNNDEKYKANSEILVSHSFYKRKIITALQKKYNYDIVENNLIKRRQFIMENRCQRSGVFKCLTGLALMMSVSLAHALSCPLTGKNLNEKCINVGGYQLYMQTHGQGPTVVFESGLGDASWNWDKVTPEVAKFARTVTYDREGLGLSQKNANNASARTAEDAVKNLRLLLTKANIKPPYILVGHSLGGLYMQLFAQEYPNEVAGVVLVDSASPAQKADAVLPPVDARYYLEAQGMETSIEQVKNAPEFPNIPLYILSSSQEGSRWLSLQSNFRKLSPQSKQFVTKESGHYIQREQPELVVDAIRDIVARVEQ